jgi:diketogulonate reductase-like aldo/keto reductase
LQTSSGKELHPIGIGTWKVVDTSQASAIQYSISKGQNHIDTAEMYGDGDSERVVGLAIEGFTREDLYIASKLWKTSVGKGHVLPAVKAMLSRMKTDYIDLLYIHSPWDDAPWLESIPQIDEVIDAGLVRHFGVSNFSVEQMKQARAISKHPIAANQMRYSILNRDSVPPELIEHCKAQNVALVAYTPLGRGSMDDNEVIRGIADEHDATVSQVALKWLIDRDTLPIPKATSEEHIDDNLGALKLELTPDEMHTLDVLQ